MRFLGCCAASVWRHFVPTDEIEPRSIQGWLWAWGSSQRQCSCASKWSWDCQRCSPLYGSDPAL